MKRPPERKLLVAAALVLLAAASATASRPAIGFAERAEAAMMKMGLLLKGEQS